MVKKEDLLPSQHGYRRRYYTPDEVAAHNSADDLWLSIFDHVFDLTSLVQEHRTNLAQPLVLHAGQDISHWFDATTRNVKTYYDEKRGLFLPYTPMGSFLHVLPAEPDGGTVHVAVPWWKNSEYIVGKVSKNVRHLKVVNTLTQQSDVLKVCAEETFAEIQSRYAEYNAHATSYTWKHLLNDAFVPLDMARTLDQSGIPDEGPLFDKLHIDSDLFLPTVHLYFNDDLTYK